jgi:natural product precursor
MPFPFYKQPDAMDCGPTCLRMIAKHYGRNYKQQTLNKMCDINREGVSLLGLSDAAEKIGFRTLGVKLNAEQLKEAELPCTLPCMQPNLPGLVSVKSIIKFNFMEKFKKLSRDEMKNVKGGGNGGCNIGASCVVYVGEPGNGGGYADGNCAIVDGACNCTNGVYSASSPLC